MRIRSLAILFAALLAVSTFVGCGSDNKGKDKMGDGKMSDGKMGDGKMSDGKTGK